MDKEETLSHIQEAWELNLIMRSIDTNEDGEYLWISNEIGMLNPNFVTHQEWKNKHD